VRSRVPTLDDDRSPSADIAAITELIASHACEDACDGRVK
jgi:histidine ammonia-lyase